jgi:two-component system osmolarity sensor histidine kinase EnvZ
MLIAATVAFFSLICWAAIVWTTIIPAAEATAHVLAQRATAAIAAYKSGAPLPQDIEFRSAPPASESRWMHEFSFSLYLNHLRTQLRRDLPGSQVFVARAAMPTRVWIRSAELPDRWLVLRWQVSRPETPAAIIVVVLTGALLVLTGAAMFARRLTAPLAALVAATDRIAQGERVMVNTTSGPSEVRSLGAAFQSMSHRLAELDEQRELMLAGLSHDLRSPLARLRVAVELLDTRDTVLTEQMAGEIEEIDRMVGQFLHYVRAGYRETPVEGCLDDIVQESLTRHHRGEKLQLDLNAAEPRLLAVESVRHVLLNLVQNALEYGQVPVTIRTRLAPGRLSISVEDSGHGIPEREWQEALRPFHRLRATPGTGHTGLGLATVERLVRACHGTVVGSLTEGGFVVNVTLATNEPPPSQRAEQARAGIDCTRQPNVRM